MQESEADADQPTPTSAMLMAAAGGNLDGVKQHLAHLTHVDNCVDAVSPPFMRSLLLTWWKSSCITVLDSLAAVCQS
jgi:hypothetical protein